MCRRMGGSGSSENAGPIHEGLELPRRWGVTRGSSDIVTRTPGGKPSGVLLSRGHQIASSKTREKQAITTLSAPACLSADTQALLVAPLVSTSSTNKMFVPWSR